MLDLTWKDFLNKAIQNLNSCYYRIVGFSDLIYIYIYVSIVNYWKKYLGNGHPITQHISSTTLDPNEARWRRLDMGCPHSILTIRLASIKVSTLAFCPQDSFCFLPFLTYLASRSSRKTRSTSLASSSKSRSFPYSKDQYFKLSIPKQCTAALERWSLGRLKRERGMRFSFGEVRGRRVAIKGYRLAKTAVYWPMPSLSDSVCHRNASCILCFRTCNMRGRSSRVKGNN